jgi:hypothetical protein
MPKRAAVTRAGPNAAAGRPRYRPPPTLPPEPGDPPPARCRFCGFAVPYILRLPGRYPERRGVEDVVSVLRAHTQTWHPAIARRVRQHVEARTAPWLDGTRRERWSGH